MAFLTSSQEYILSTCFITDLDHLPEVGFPHSSAHHPTPFHTVLLGRHVQPTVRNGNSIPLLKDRTFTYVVCNCSTQVCVFSLIYLFNYIFVSVQMQEHSFYSCLFCC